MTHTAHSAFEAAHFERANRRQAHIKRLENGITELSAHIYAATYRLLELIREYDECKGWAQPKVLASFRQGKVFTPRCGP